MLASKALMADDDAHDDIGIDNGFVQGDDEALKAAEKLQAAGEAICAFTQAQLGRVVDHLVEMMAQTHFRVLPAAQQEELLQKEGFDVAEHFAKRLEIIHGVYYDVFKSKCIYGANLQNFEAVRKLIDQIVKRDRLPSSNSLQAQHALRNAWNTIDVCVYNAGYYKRLAKVAYILCLLLGTAIIVLSVFKTHINGNRERLACFDICRLKAANGGNCTITACDTDQEEAGISVTPTAIFVTASLLTMVRRSPTAIGF